MKIEAKPVQVIEAPASDITTGEWLGIIALAFGLAAAIVKASE